MKRWIANPVLAACVVLAALESALVPAAEERGMERYTIILDRKPFGSEAAPVVELPPSVPPEQSLINQFRMSAVVRDEAGVLRVGLVEIKSSRNFILDIGGSVDGVQVVSADYAAEKARLRRGVEEYWVSMQGGSNRFERILPGAPAAEASSVAPESAAAPRERVLPGGVDQRRSYALRRQQREEARLRKELERLRALEAERTKALAKSAAESTGTVSGVMRAGKAVSAAGVSGRAMVDSLAQSENIELTPEEIGNLLQEYQKDLIRKGMTPLPIPLTPETDKELVEEGLLPPLE